jgi:hypothetical protein
MRLATVLFFAASLSACRYDAAFIEVTVTGSAPATTQLACTVTSTVSGTAKISVPAAAAAAPLDFPQSFTLQLPTAARAQVTIVVSAGTVSASSVVEIHGDGLYRTTIALGGSGDLSTAHGDLAGDDLSGEDGSTPSDLSVPKGYMYARDVTFHHASIGAAGGLSYLTDYPAPVQITDATLADTAHGGHVAEANGADITFIATGRACNGPPTCTLASEIVSYNATTGALAAWVRVPALNTVSSTQPDTVVTMLYGNAGLTAPLIDPALTWDSDFLGVWHLASSQADSTAKAHDGSTTTFVASTTPIFGGATAMGGTAANIVQVPDDPDFNFQSDFSISLWVRTAQKTGQGVALGKYIETASFTDGYTIFLDLSASPRAWYGEIYTTMGEATGGSGGDLSDNAWHLLTMVRQGANLLTYQDGQFLSSMYTPGGATGDPTNAAPLVFGAECLESATDPYAFFTGAEEEVRVSSIARSAAWIATDYALITTASAITIGVEHAP